MVTYYLSLSPSLSPAGGIQLKILQKSDDSLHANLILFIGVFVSAVDTLQFLTVHSTARFPIVKLGRGNIRNTQCRARLPGRRKLKLN